jgi:hypothetical protein
MKYSLQISLLGSAVLLGFLGWQARRQQETVSADRPKTTAAQSGVARFGAARFARLSRSSPVTNAVPATSWAALTPNDLPQFIANLRHVGCPEQTIRDIITLQVCRNYRNRLLDLQTVADRTWDYTRNHSPAAAKEFSRQQSDLPKAMDRELESLLGVSADQLISTVSGWPENRSDYVFLSLEKQGRLRDLHERYRDLTEEARQGLLSWESDATMDARIKELNLQKQAELAQFLTPQELEALNLRESAAARYVLNYLPEASSEAEFKQMVQAVEEVGIESPKMGDLFSCYLLPGRPDTSNEDAKMATKQAELAVRLRQLLGEQRIAAQQQEEQARLARAQQQQYERDRQQARAH